jgi:hypothetical protein
VFGIVGLGFPQQPAPAPIVQAGAYGTDEWPLWDRSAYRACTRRLAALGNHAHIPPAAINFTATPAIFSVCGDAGCY